MYYKNIFILLVDSMQEGPEVIDMISLVVTAMSEKRQQTMEELEKIFALAVP